MTTLDKARGWPFVGREQELKAISSAYGSASVHAVFLTGEAGVGKTRLAREALRRLGGRGEWVAASSAAAQIPFGALVHLVPDRVPVTAGSVQLMRAIGRRVRQAAVLGVDDAHLLDEASSAVIASLAGPVFVVATVRGGEGLADCLARLLRAGTARLLEVGVLPGSAMDLLIGPDRSAAERRRLRALAAGNPLALRELLHGAAPGGLTELMAARLAGLDPLTRRVVETIACGEPVPLPVLERLAGLEAVAEAESSGLIVGERSGERAQARLAHPLLGEVARRRAPVARLRQVHRDLAQQLMATPMRRRDDVLRAALWQVEGGEIIWPGLVREGARLAAGREGTALAERLARVACEAEPGAEADRLLAEILQYQGRTDEATLLLPGTPPGGTHERVRWTITRAEGLYWTHGDLTGALRAYEAVKGHPLADGARAFLLFFAGRHAETLLVAEPVLNRFESGPETPGWSGPGRAGRRPHGPASQAAVWAAAAAIASLGFQGRLDEALAVRDEVLPVARANAADLPWGIYQIDVATCLAYLAAGRPGLAAALAADGYREGSPMMTTGWALYGGIAAAVQGELERADALLGEAVAGFGAHDTFRLLRCCLMAHAWVHALRGDPAATTLMARADALDNRTNQVFEPWITSWRAWVASCEGDTAAALRHAETAAELAAAAGAPIVEALARYDRSRLAGIPDLPSLARLTGRTASGPSALGRIADDLAGLGYHLHAAELAAAAARTPRTALAATKAAELRARHPGARTPLLDATAPAHDVLTPRERQVALLAVRHSSRQIAERLGLSVRTVDNALARVYVKLGVSGRDGLRRMR